MALAHAFVDEDGSLYGEPEWGMDGIDFPFVPPSGRFKGRRLVMYAKPIEGSESDTWISDADGEYRGCYATQQVEELLDMDPPPAD